MASNAGVVPVLGVVVDGAVPAVEEGAVEELVVVEVVEVDGSEGRDDEVAALGCADVPQAAATDAVPTSDAMVTAIRTGLTSRG